MAQDVPRVIIGVGGSSILLQQVLIEGVIDFDQVIHQLEPFIEGEEDRGVLEILTREVLGHFLGAREGDGFLIQGWTSAGNL